jgi:predicted phosphodiesterase
MSEPENAIRFGILAEIHHAPTGTPRSSWHNELLLDRSDELLDLALTKIEKHDIDELVLLGDLTNDATTESFSAVHDKTMRPGVPVLAVPGNHDINEPGALTPFVARLDSAPFASAPRLLQRQPGIATMLVAIDRDGSTNTLHSSGFPDVYRLSGQTLLVFSHYPLLPMESRLRDAGLKHAGDLSDRQQIGERLLNHDGPVVVVHGHLHVRAAIAEQNILHLSCAALVEPPHEVTVLELNLKASGRQYVDRTAIDVLESEAVRMPVLVPRSEHWVYDGQAWTRSTPRNNPG